MSRDTERIYRALLYYRAGGDGTREEWEELALDALTDLMRWSDEYGVDFESVLRDARQAYSGEAFS